MVFNQVDGEGEECGIDSTLEVAEAVMVPTATTVEDTEPHPCSPISTIDDVEHGLTQPSSENEPQPSVSHETDDDSKNEDPAKASCLEVVPLVNVEPSPNF